MVSTFDALAKMSELGHCLSNEAFRLLFVLGQHPSGDCFRVRMVDMPTQLMGDHVNAVVELQSFGLDVENMLGGGVKWRL